MVLIGVVIGIDDEVILSLQKAPLPFVYGEHIGDGFNLDIGVSLDIGGQEDGQQADGPFDRQAEDQVPGADIGGILKGVYQLPVALHSGQSVFIQFPARKGQLG